MPEPPASPSPAIPFGAEALFRNAFTYAGIGMALVGLDGRFLQVNPALCRITGYSAEALTSYTFQQITYPPDLAEDLAQVERLMNGQIASYQIEKRYIRSDQSLVWVKLTGSLVRNEDGNPAYYIAQVEDISARIETERALRNREARLAAIWAATNDAMSLSDAEGVVLEANPAYLKLYGYQADEVIGRSFAVIFPPEQQEWAINEYRNTFYHAPAESMFETQVVRYDGAQRIVEARATFLEDAGARVAMLSTIRDITEQKQMEQELRSSLAEKEVLLKEVHHRVKNNLQVIISLLRIQAQQTDDPQIRNQFNDTQNRVRAMAVVHELLYSTPDLASVNLAVYARQLALGVLRSYSVRARPLNLEITVAPEIELSIDIAAPLGLIMTELISNSVKYAFPPDHNGTITIAAEWADNRLRLRMSDDGVGLSADIPALSAHSLGLQLVQRLVLQLGGTLHVEPATGAAFVIDIPLIPRGSYVGITGSDSGGRG